MALSIPRQSERESPLRVPNLDLKQVQHSFSSECYKTGGEMKRNIIRGHAGNVILNLERAKSLDMSLRDILALKGLTPRVLSEYDNKRDCLKNSSESQGLRASKNTPPNTNAIDCLGSEKDTHICVTLSAASPNHYSSSIVADDDRPRSSSLHHLKKFRPLPILDDPQASLPPPIDAEKSYSLQKDGECAMEMDESNAHGRPEKTRTRSLDESLAHYNDDVSARPKVLSLKDGEKTERNLNIWRRREGSQRPSSEMSGKQNRTADEDVTFSQSNISAECVYNFEKRRVEPSTQVEKQTTYLREVEVSDHRCCDSNSSLIYEEDEEVIKGGTLEDLFTLFTTKRENTPIQDVAVFVHTIDSVVGSCAFKIGIKTIYLQLVEDVENQMPPQYLLPRQEGLAQFMECWARSFDRQSTMSSGVMSFFLKVLRKLQMWGISNSIQAILLENENTFISVPLLRRLGAHSFDFSENVSVRRRVLGNTLNEMTPRDIAEMITFANNYFMQQLSKKDLLKPSKQSALMSLASLFNQVSGMVASRIVMHDDRVGQIKKYILVAKELQKMGDFNGLMAIMAGLGSVAISRLKRDWKELPVKQRQTWQNFEELMSQKKGYNKYRKEIERRPKPVIPYLAVYLRDIIYTKDGNPRHLKEAVEGEEPTINFQRLRLLYQQMKKFHSYTTTPFEIVIKEEVLEAIVTYPVYSEDDLYELSLQIQPTTQDQSSHQPRSKQISLPKSPVCAPKSPIRFSSALSPIFDGSSHSDSLHHQLTRCASEKPQPQNYADCPNSAQGAPASKAFSLKRNNFSFSGLQSSRKKPYRCESDAVSVTTSSLSPLSLSSSLASEESTSSDFFGRRKDSLVESSFFSPSSQKSMGFRSKGDAGLSRNGSSSFLLMPQLFQRYRSPSFDRTPPGEDEEIFGSFRLPDSKRDEYPENLTVILNPLLQLAEEQQDGTSA